MLGLWECTAKLAYGRFKERFYFLLLICMCICVWMYIHVSTSDWSSEEDVGSPGAEVSGSGETLYMVIRNQTQVL